ncbi:interleukin-17D [Salvelinus namaycush]|uniref:Interleukin-17D n=1 Tax=Salvelinus namaycush TaxID=8040 RepID=A0A8U1F5I2_SALNM|nr:interleukin-17D [Salvelinus namaycush]
MFGGVSFVCLLLVLLCDMASVAKVSKKSTQGRQCLDLPEEILEQMFGRLSVGVLSAFHHTLQLAPLERKNLTCPSAGRPVPDRKSRIPVNLLSLSPWAYRISHDPARYPRFIPEAYCLCKGCLIGPFGQESDQYRSTPVYMPSVILRRTGSCVGGRHSYTESYVSVAVGCTCVPLLEKDRDAQSSNQSLEREHTKADELSSNDKNI